jgi:hypothetical protein
MIMGVVLIILIGHFGKLPAGQTCPIVFILRG